MTWRTHIQTLKAAPKLNMGAPVSTGGVAYTPTTALGWRDHFQDQRKAQLTDEGQGKTGVADQVAQHLTDDPGHQAAISGAINGALGGTSSNPAQ
jgi:hypothetical protein